MRAQWVVLVFLIGAIAPSLAAQTAATLPCDSIQYRFVDTTASPRSHRYRASESGRSYALDDTVVLQATDIQRVDVWRHQLAGDTVWDVVATLTAAAARRFATATAAHVGRTMAVRVGEEISATGLIMSPLSGTKAVIATNVSSAVADSLAARARHATSPSCRSQ